MSSRPDGRHTAVLLSALLALAATGAATSSAGASPSEAAWKKPLAKNVILLIDDGAGYRHHEAASLYETGLRAGEVYQTDFPFKFAMSTYSYGDYPPGGTPDAPVGYDPAAAWSDFDYVSHDPTDSAAAATAMATGVKTYDAAIGVDRNGDPVGPNLVELAESRGMSTGVVTSVPFSHATPAGFVAHHTQRDDYPVLAHQMIQQSGLDVLMGAGNPEFDKEALPVPKPGYVWVSKEDWLGLEGGTAGTDPDGDGVPDPALAWTLVQDRAAFQALEHGETPARVAGIVQSRRTLQQERPGDPLAPPYTAPQVENVPTLPEMTRGALNVLDDAQSGFFLMVEGGATDWAAHDNQPGRMIEEELSFDRAVDAVLAWVDQHSNWGETMVVVTSDHETGYLTGPGSGTTADGPVWTPLTDNGVGVVPGMEFHLKVHTNSLVPVYAKGDAGRLLRRTVDGTDPVRGPYVDNTDIFRLVAEATAGPRS